MPKGQKFGGRRKGTPNRATLEREAVASAQANRTGQKLLKDILSEIANRAYQLSMAYAPNRERKPDAEGKPDPFQADEGKSRAYMVIALHAATNGAQYQSPKMQPTALRDDTPDEPIEVKLVIVRRKTPMLELQANDVSEPTASSS